MRDKRKLPDITPAAVDAYRRGAASDLHVALGLAPWQISPLALHLFPAEPSPEYLERGRDKIFLSSWHQARALKDALDEAIAREDR